MFAFFSRPEHEKKKGRMEGGKGGLEGGEMGLGYCGERKERRRRMLSKPPSAASERVAKYEKV